MTSKPSGDGDHNISSQLIAAQDLSCPACCNLCPPSFALSLPVAVTLRLFFHALSGQQVDLNAFNSCHFPAR